MHKEVNTKQEIGKRSRRGIQNRCSCLALATSRAYRSFSNSSYVDQPSWSFNDLTVHQLSIHVS